MSVPARTSEAADTRGDEASFAYAPFLIATAVLSVLVPSQVIMQVTDQGRSNAWGLAILVMVWAGLRLSLLLGEGAARFCAFFFWLYTYVFLGLAPAIQIRSNRPSTTTPDVLPSLDALALGIVLVGIFCFELGTLLSRLRGSGDVTEPPHRAPRLNSRAVITVWAVGMTAATYYVSQMGPGTLYSNRDSAAAARALLWPNPPVRSIVLSLSTYPVLVAVGALVQLSRFTDRRNRVLYLALATAGILALALVVSPLSSARYPLGTVAFALAVMIGGAAATARRVRGTLALTVLGLFFVFPLADAFRREERDLVREGFVAEYQGNPDYDSIWQIANASAYWLADKADAGGQIIGTLLFWVPRSIWDSKPVDTGTLLANYYGYTFTNLSAPLWAEAMINGGLAAVVIAFVALGYGLSRLDLRVIESLRPGGPWAIAGAIIPVYLMIILRGSLLQATGTVVVVTACLIAIRYSGGVSEPLPARTAPPVERR